MLDIVRITLRSLLGKNKDKLPVAPLTLADQVLLPDGSNVAQALTELRAIAAGASVLRVAPTLAERDALPGLQISWQVWVVDATADPTVERGAAKYLYTGGISGLDMWIKTAEAESMDVALRWEALQNVPQVLRELSVDVDGLLTLGGQVVHDGKTDVVILDEGQPLPNSVRTGGLALVRASAGDDLVPCLVGYGAASPIVPSLKGRTGDKGEKGDKGDTGEKGDTGAQGIQGVPGLQGLPGTTGATGATGQPGRDGAAGQNGAAGRDGAPGPQGPPGALGPQGPKGDTPPLNNTVTSTSTTEAATANAVKTAYDRGSEAINAANNKAPGGFGLGSECTRINSWGDQYAAGFFQTVALAQNPNTTIAQNPNGKDGWFVGYVASHQLGAWATQHVTDINTGERFFRAGPVIKDVPWTQLPSTISKHFSPAGTRGGSIAAYAHYAVPAYTVGSGRLQVWLDGILCECGGNAAQHQYQEVGAAGAWSNVIQFHDSIDGSFDISARVR